MKTMTIDSMNGVINTEFNWLENKTRKALLKITDEYIKDCIDNDIETLSAEGAFAYFEWLKKSRNSLHKDGEYDDISDFHLQMLSKIYHTCNAHIVLTSTWRELDDESDMNCYPMYQYLVNSLAKYDMKIISKTPVINMNRPLEIVTWLDSRVDKDKIKFVSLDDDFSKEDYEEYGIGDCLVHTRFFCNDISKGGLQQEHVDRAIEILNGE